MSEIQNKLDSLQPYIVGMRFIQGLQVVDAVFKEKWTVPESDIIKKELVDPEKNYYMFYTEKDGVTFDDLLDYVEGIININIERENKNELFKAKVKELQKVFSDNSLSKLELLKFKFNDPEPVSEFDDIDLNTEFNEPEVSLNGVKYEKGDGVTDVANDAVNDATTEQPPIIIPEETTITNVKGQDIELPPKNEKIVVEEFEVPTNIVCKCGPDEACPVCEEEKFG